ncbi:hypothetical protein GW966_14775, partial [Clostridium perfringens]|nr:hypothetical protein [Clostridium perfringens]
AFIFIIAYPLYSLKLRSKELIFVFLSLVLIFLLKTKIFNIIYFIWINETNNSTNINAYTMLIIMIFVYILAIIMSKNSNNDNIINACKNYMLMSIVIQIFASESNVVMRAGYYYYIFITLLIPNIIEIQKDKLIKNMGLILLIILLIIFYYLTTHNGYLNVVPYKFFWSL